MSNKVHMLRSDLPKRYVNNLSLQLMCGFTRTNKMEVTHLISEVTCGCCLYSLNTQQRIRYDSDREFMSWSMFDRAVDCIIERVKELKVKPKVIYGIPRNGLILAVTLSHKLSLPMISGLRTGSGYELNEVLIVDDICDTGTTLSKYSGIPTIALYYKPNISKKEPTIFVYQSDHFVQFPWETTESAKVDYLEDDHNAST